MAGSALTVTFEGEAAERFLELAAASGRTSDWFADFMIRQYAAREMEIVAKTKAGIADAEAGRTVSHEDAMARLDATTARAAHRDAAERRALRWTFIVLAELDDTIDHTARWDDVAKTRLTLRCRRHRMS
jgi:predicted transcriptional regulator